MKSMVSEMRIPLMRSEIIRIRAKAFRRGVWFRVLTRVERACVDLAIIVVERVRSRLLRRILFAVVRKLEEAFESPVRRLMRDVGGSLAHKMSVIAVKWGNKSAVEWAEDSGYIRYLTVNHMNLQL
jgi:hypothetical protein